MRGKKKQKRKTKWRKIQIINKTAVIDFGQMYQSIQSRHNIFQVQCFRVLVCVRLSWEVNKRLSLLCWITNATSHFFVLSVKIDGKVLKSNALKSDTGRYYPACHSHPLGLLCVCPVYTPHARGKGSMAPCHTV